LLLSTELPAYGVLGNSDGIKRAGAFGTRLFRWSNLLFWYCLYEDVALTEEKLVRPLSYYPVVHRTPKPTPEKIAKIWAQEWAKEGWQIDWQKLLPRRGFELLPRRWVVERTFSWLSQNRWTSKEYERLCATGEAFIYVAMSRLMVRRLARS
jgi:hypothetical protein